MLGLLLNMSGPPTRGDVEDLLLSWVVMNREGFEGLDDESDDEDHEPRPQRVGNLLADVYVNSFYHTKRDGPLLSGEELFQTVLKAWKKAFRPRLVRELKKRPKCRSFDEIYSDEDLCENSGLWWLESIELEKATLPRKQARMIGEALGGLEASSTIQMWTYAEDMDKAEATA